MLYVKYCTDWKHNAAKAVSEICERSEKGTGRKLLIVPEQNSFDTEWALCEAGGDRISRFAEVLSFTRLAARVFSVAGGAAVPTLDKSGRLIAMANALELIRPHLKLYGRHAAKPEFLLQLLRITDEFHGYGLTAESVRNAQDGLPAELSNKLKELLLILDTYDMVCSRAKQDPSTRLDRLRGALHECEYCKNAWVVVNGFTDFTGQELSVLEEILVQAEQVTVYLVCDDRSRGQGAFDVTRKTIAELENLAARRNVISRVVRELRPAGDPVLDHLALQLYEPRLNEWKDPAPQICVCSEKTAPDEAEAAVGRIQALTMAGSRYRDVGIAYTDDAVYGPLVENLLGRYGIPAYYSGSSDVLRQPMIRAVVYALEAAAQGMEPASVAEYLKSGYAPVTPDMADRIENYAYVWNLRGSRWDAPFDRDPVGIRADRKQDPEKLTKKLELLNEAREAAVLPLCTLRKELSEAKNVGEQVFALDRFLDRIGLNKQLEEEINRLQERGALQTVQELSQLYEILLDTMEQVFGVLGTSVRTPDEFYRFFRAAISQNTVGSIPSTLDCVRVGRLSAMRGVRVKHLLVLGANDGLLPALDQTGSLLSDADRRSMVCAGLPVAPDDLQRIDRELLTAYTVFTAPTESLFVTGDREAPSFLLTRLEKLFPNCVGKHPKPLPVTPEQAAAIAAEAPPAARVRILRELPELTEPIGRLIYRAGYTPGTLDRKAVENLYGPHLFLDATKIDAFASCKYAYFLRYGLKIRERRQARIDASVYGTFVHDVLEHTVKSVEEEGGFKTVSLERTLELAEQYCDRYVEENLNGLEQLTKRGSYLFQRNYQEVLAVVRELYGELHQSEFRPTFYELKFDGDTAIQISGNLAVGSLTGAVDRVDLYTTPAGKTYLRVVDYKSGKKDFDYTDLLEGIGLQMLIYLFVLTREAERFYGKPLEPAGVLYFPARYDVESSKYPLTAEKVDENRRKKLIRKGLLLNDESILRAMEENEPPVYLPYTIDGKTLERGGDLATTEQLSMLSRFVLRTLGVLADKICGGQIEPDPYWRGPDQNACRWCEYKEVCHVNSGEVDLRRLQKTKKDLFWEILEKEEKKDG